MRKAGILAAICILVILSAFRFSDTERELMYIPPSPQRGGDADKGYEYLITGDFVSSGVPYDIFIAGAGISNDNRLYRTGRNARVSHGFNVIDSENGTPLVVPTCLQCHAQVFEDKLYVGLGNSFSDFTHTGGKGLQLTMLRLFSPSRYKAGKDFFTSYKTLAPEIRTSVRGVNTADRLAAVLAAHRDPETLVWSTKALLKIPDEVYPTDVPAWWLLRKKNAMFYNGFGRGDFSKYLMASNLLTVKDTAEANKVYQRFGDVLAYINSLKPPPYPYAIDNELAAKGKALFYNNCSTCHGTYGRNEQYPNLLIPESIIGTDSMLFKANQQNPQFIDWFNRSWFAKGEHPARLVPSEGYVAPPLDGVWVTAPYLHNGSVPTLEAVLNSKNRPAYWSRDFQQPQYDYNQVGWKYQEHIGARNTTVYNTTLPGYGNYGHYFGDHLSDAERKAVIEYLKTL